MYMSYTGPTGRKLILARQAKHPLTIVINKTSSEILVLRSNEVSKANMAPLLLSADFYHLETPSLIEE